MKAIETIYQGYKFRSRLEARWAVFFDTLGVKWEYEEEGYEIEFDNEIIRYLPDFRIGEHDHYMFAEVKGDPEYVINNEQDFTVMHDYGGILPGFHNSYGTRNGLLLLGNIPEPSEYYVHLHPFIQHHEGLIVSYVMFVPPIRDRYLYCAKNTILERLVGVPDGTPIGELNITPISIPVREYYLPVYEAYRQARQARFEHGETPCI